MGRITKTRKHPNRREFLKRTAMGTAGFALASSFPGFSGSTWGDEKTSRVVIVTDENASSGLTIMSDVIQVMMDRGIMEFTDQPGVGEAWRSLFPSITSSSKIGIKVNCLNHSLFSHPEVVEVIIEGLAQMEVNGSQFVKNNIIVWDRNDYDLTSSGYSLYTGNDPERWRCFGTLPGIGYDSANQLNVNSRTCNPSKILTQHLDYLINLSVLKNHTISGVTFSLKNHYGSVHNPSSLHGSNCNLYIPALNRQLRDQLSVQHVVNICDAIFGIYHGGPTGNPQFAYNGFLISQDPVALDYQAMQILDDNGCNTLHMATHIATAAYSPYELGTNDPAQMDFRHIVDPSTGVSEEQRVSSRPEEFTLGAAYPNPFNARTVIPYHIGGGSSQPVSLEIYNVRGQRVRNLFRGVREPGEYRVIWDARGEDGTLEQRHLSLPDACRGTSSQSQDQPVAVIGAGRTQAGRIRE